MPLGLRQAPLPEKTNFSNELVTGAPTSQSACQRHAKKSTDRPTLISEKFAQVADASAIKRMTCSAIPTNHP
jgi:hypothetical protein